jgi:EmrB/QacA subfamily drug resistance transporter
MVSERTATRQPLGGELIAIACILSLGAFAALLDTTVVGVAVRTLSMAFAANLAETQWATTAYLLALAAVIPGTGWAAARFGATAAWIGSLGVFLAGSVLCGLSWSLASLIAFRVLQGAGAGLLFPLLRIVVAEVAGRDRLGRMVTIVAIPVQLAPVIGPVVGGAVIQELSWRWVFFLNVPVVVAAIVLSAVYIPNRRGPGQRRLDVIGLLSVSGGLTLLIFGLSGAGDGRSVLAPMVLGIALLAVHGVRAVRSRLPGVIEFDLFRDKAFAASSALAFLSNFGLFAVVFLVPLASQQDGGTGALRAGLILAPQGIGMLVAVLAVGRLVDMKSNLRALVMGGLTLVVIGTIPFTVLSPAAPVVLPVALFVRGVGVAFAVAPTMITLYHSLPACRVAAATTANAIAQQIGAGAGTACVAVLLQRLVALGGLETGFHLTFLATLAFVALSFVPAAFLPDRR